MNAISVSINYYLRDQLPLYEYEQPFVSFSFPVYFAVLFSSVQVFFSQSVQLRLHQISFVVMKKQTVNC